jgi:hypothetical protein
MTLKRPPDARSNIDESVGDASRPKTANATGRN